MSAQTLKTDIQRLAATRPGVAALDSAAAPAPVLEQTGLGTAPRAGASTAGIASPLVEQDYADRTFHGTHSMTSTDGLFTLEYRHLATLTLRDANGAQVVLQFEDE